MYRSIEKIFNVVVAAPTRPPPEPCTSGLFTCDDGTCIEQSLVCDRKYDCPDGSDEFKCDGQYDTFTVVPNLLTVGYL